MRSLLSACAVSLIFLLTAVAEVYSDSLLNVLQAAALVIFLALEWAPTPRHGKVLLMVTTLIVAGAWGRLDAPVSVLCDGLSRGAFFVSFFVAVGLLQHAAAMSPTVTRCGEFMVQQPPGRRYLMLSVGGHLCAVVLSIATLGLFATMINRVNTLDSARGQPWVQAVRRKRMATSLMRGVNATALWSPFSVALVVTHVSLGTRSLASYLPVAMLTATLFLASGWVLDRFSVTAAQRNSVAPLRSSEHWTVLLRIAAIVGAIFCGAYGVGHLLAVDLLAALMISVPVASVLWAFSTSHEAAALLRIRRVAGHLQRHAVEWFPAHRAEASVMTAAGVIGVTVAELVSAQYASALLAQTNLPAYVLLILLAALIVLLAQIAIVPIVAVTVIAAAFPPAVIDGVSEATTMLALVGGWTLAALSSPFSGLALITGRLFDTPARVVAYDWNLAYSASGFVLLSAIIGLQLTLE